MGEEILEQIDYGEEDNTNIVGDIIKHPEILVIVIPIVTFVVGLGIPVIHSLAERLSNLP